MSLLGSFSSAMFMGVAVRPAVQPVQPTMIQRTDMMMRRFPQMDEDLYSCQPRSMTATTQMSRPLRLAEVTARVITTIISCAGGAVSSSQ